MAEEHNHPNVNPNGYYNQQQEYINFDQFVMQHNFTQYYPTAAPLPPPTISYPIYAPNEFHQPTAYIFPAMTEQLSIQTAQEQLTYFMEPPPLPPPNDDLVRNSNLIPTANEFVPMLQQPFIAEQQQTEFDYITEYTEHVLNNNPIEHIEPHATDNIVYSIEEEPPVTNDETLAATLDTINIGKTQGAVKKTYNNRHGTTGAQSTGNGSRSEKDNQRKTQWNDNGKNRTENWKKEQPLPRRLGGSGRTASQYDDRNYQKHQNYSANNRYADDRSDGRADKSNGRGDRSDRSDYRSGRTDNNRSDWSDNRTADRYHQDNNWSNGREKNYRQQQHSKNNDRQFYDKQQQSNDDSASSNHKFEKKKHADFKVNRNLKPTPTESNDSAQCSQREKLLREIDAGKLECLVCCENIKPFQSSWSCANCFHIIHLNCIIKWADSSKAENGWRCPACQHVSEKIPKEYYCFCGKLKNPQYNRNDVAHSCGELCGKKDQCEHPCTLLCHPGPCPTCHASVTRECGCGRSKKTMQCCQKEDIQCEEVCDKPLNCKFHKCEQQCHVAPCEHCENKVEHKCHCGKDRKEVVCEQDSMEVTRYSCGKQCNRQLSCKLHKCKDICHPGDCGDCKLLPDVITSCPCGKTPILPGQRKTCSDPVPMCQSICSKPLKCGQPSSPHQCTNKCHNGNCAGCNKETAVRCRCGHMEQMIKCRQLSTRADDARCKKRCTKKRNCGKHKCNQECCIDIDHICPIPCNFNLSCGKHKCDQTCHKGRCQRCYQSSFVELYCECGANVIYPPVPCGSKKPPCDRPCSRTHQCNHPVQHSCHSAATCPPCMAFTSTYCFGRHEERKTIPCSQGDFSCGLKCNKPLRCEQHKCIKICHPGICEQEQEVCKQNCNISRIMCTHNCNAPCHAGQPCPETACREMVEVLCQCGHRKANRSCQEFSNDYRRIASAKLASTMMDMQRGTSFELSDVLGPIKMNNNKTLECNEECKLLERNRKLAIGLQIRNPDISSKLQPKYSDFIKSWAKKDQQLVTMIHDKLSELVKLAKTSKQRSRSHSFPTMNREKRQLVHEMCAMFGVQSVAYDAEPNRNVVANATKETSWLPSMSIFEVLQRESGQRRIPVPTNNAWGVKK